MDIKHKYDKILLSKNANRLFIVSCISIIFFQIMWVQTVLGKFDVFDAFSNIGQNYYERLEFSTGNDKVFLCKFEHYCGVLRCMHIPLDSISLNN